MDDFQFISTFSILIDEMLEEGNYEVMANGVFVEFTVNGTFITRTELCNIRDCKKHITHHQRQGASRTRRTGERERQPRGEA